MRKSRLALAVGSVAILGLVGLAVVVRSVKPANLPAAPGSTASAATDASAASATTGTPAPRGPLTETPVHPPPAVEVESRYTGNDLARFRKMSPDRQAKEYARTCALEKVVLDPKASSYDRVQAFAQLEHLGCLSRPTVTAAAALLASVPDRSQQRAMLSESLGARPAFPEVQEALLARLSADDNEMVRKRAAMSLQNVNEDPRVRQALEKTARDDPSEFVRKAAQRALVPPRPERK